jgi:hypothetical protein
MLTLPELVDALDVVTYKPEWSLVVRELDPHQGPFLSLVADLPNSADPTVTVPLRIHSPIPPMRDVPAFYEWLLWRLARVELHEALEWFQVHGKPWRDPHAGLD